MVTLQTEANAKLGGGGEGGGRGLPKAMPKHSFSPGLEMWLFVGHFMPCNIVGALSRQLESSNVFFKRSGFTAQCAWHLFPQNFVIKYPVKIGLYLFYS